MVSGRRPLIRQEEEHAVVTPLELFFDLVFVFALTQVTAFMADELSWQGILRGALVLMLLWWAWTGYAWLANTASAEERPIKLAILTGMAAMFVLALCIPEAFDDLPGGLSGPVVLAICYLLFRLMHVVMFLIISREDPGLRSQVFRFGASVLASTALLLVASQFEGWLQTGLWALALAADYIGTALGGFSGWRLPSPGHFSERHGLIIIIALGESIVAVGVGVAQEPITWVIIAASVLALLLSSSLWWAYFDLSALLGEHALATEPLETRVRLARNAYSYAHMPLVLGIVLVAFGLKEVLLYVSDSSHHKLTDPLPTVALAALIGGVVIYLLGHVVFKWLTVHTISVVRLAAAGVLLLIIPLIVGMPALAQLTVVAFIVAVAVLIESVIFAESRRKIRAELARH
ncbi:MAG TPA: low temperature requirement protein A [Propionibacteriaceae bacterium]|nr:low temperature requirement protein A [Propionibacteriaceae bacterium]